MKQAFLYIILFSLFAAGLKAQETRLNLEQLERDSATMGEVLMWDSTGWKPGVLSLTEVDPIYTGDSSRILAYRKYTGTRNLNLIKDNGFYWIHSDFITPWTNLPGNVPVDGYYALTVKETRTDFIIQRLVGIVYVQGIGPVQDMNRTWQRTYHFNSGWGPWKEVAFKPDLFSGNYTDLSFTGTTGLSDGVDDGIITEVDGSITNEIQQLARSNDTIYLSDDGFVILTDTDSTNELQQLTTDGDSIYLSKGGAVPILSSSDGNGIYSSNDTVLNSSLVYIRNSLRFKSIHSPSGYISIEGDPVEDDFNHRSMRLKFYIPDTIVIKNHFYRWYSGITGIIESENDSFNIKAVGNGAELNLMSSDEIVFNAQYYSFANKPLIYPTPQSYFLTMKSNGDITSYASSNLVNYLNLDVPLNQIIYGTGSGVTSTSEFKYDGERLIIDNVNLNIGVDAGENAYNNFPTTFGDVYIGYKAGYRSSLDTSNSNVAVGYKALYGYTGSENVTGIGALSFKNYDGTNATAIGAFSGSDADGDYHVYIGSAAGKMDSSSFTVAVGAKSLRDNNGSYVQVIGYSAGESNQGNLVQAIGTSAVEDNTGNEVIAIGNNTARNNSANDVIVFGRESARGNTYSNIVLIGDSLNATSNNQIVLGDASQTTWIQGKLEVDSVINNNSLTRVLVEDANGVIHYRDASTLSGGGSLSQPLNQIVYGTGSGVTSSADFTFNNTSNELYINGSAKIKDITQDNNLTHILVEDTSGVIKYRSVTTLPHEWEEAFGYLRPINQEPVVLGTGASDARLSLYSTTGLAQYMEADTSIVQKIVNSAPSGSAVYTLYENSTSSTARVGVNSLGAAELSGNKILLSSSTGDYKLSTSPDTVSYSNMNRFLTLSTGNKIKSISQAELINGIDMPWKKTSGVVELRVKTDPVLIGGDTVRAAMSIYDSGTALYAESNVTEVARFKSNGSFTDIVLENNTGETVEFSNSAGNAVVTGDKIYMAINGTGNEPLYIDSDAADNLLQLDGQFIKSDIYKDSINHQGEPETMAYWDNGTLKTSPIGAGAVHFLAANDTASLSVLTYVYKSNDTITLTLPTGAAISGKTYNIITDNNGLIILDPVGSVTINNATTVTLKAINEPNVKVIYDGSEYYTIPKI